MSRPVVRLICAQGPAQLLNALAVLRYTRDTFTSRNYEDHLVLGGFCLPAGISSDMLLKTCKTLAQSWPFRSVSYVPLDSEMVSDFFLSARIVRAKIPVSNVEQLYLCRNWQPLNEYLIEAYGDAERICYGDSFGLLDLNDTSIKKRPLSPKGYARISKAYLFTPAEADEAGISFSLVDDLIQPPLQPLLNMIRQQAAAFAGLQDYCRLLEQNGPKGLTLIIGSNMAEAGVMSAETTRAPNALRWLLCHATKTTCAATARASSLLRLKNPLPQMLRTYHLRGSASAQVSMYVSEINSLCNKSEVLLIKPHPRECLRQSERLRYILSKSGYTAILVRDTFRHVPLECLLCHLPITKALCMYSSTSITLPLLTSISPTNLHPFVRPDIASHFLTGRFLPSSNMQRLYQFLITQAFRGSFTPVRAIDYQR